MRKVLLSVLISSISSTAVAQDFDKGWDAYVKDEYATALKHWRPLAEQNHALAQTHLAKMYFFGFGVEQNYAEAVRLWQQPAKQGVVMALSYLSDMYYEGRGVPKNFAEAVRWYRVGAEHGYPWFQNSLGKMYLFGKGVPQDYQLAHVWFNIASGNGSEDGSFYRSVAAIYLSQELIAEAQRRARVCMESGYTECD